MDNTKKRLLKVTVPMEVVIGEAIKGEWDNGTIQTDIEVINSVEEIPDEWKDATPWGSLSISCTDIVNEFYPPQESPSSPAKCPHCGKNVVLQVEEERKSE